MSRPTYYRVLFRAAAIWSWLLSIGFLFGEDAGREAFNLPPAQPRILIDMTILPVFLFGFAYWWVSRDITRNEVVPAVGAVGGILAFCIFVARAWSGDIPPILIVPAVVDLLFGVIFLEFLIWRRRLGQASGDAV